MFLISCANLGKESCRNLWIDQDCLWINVLRAPKRCKGCDRDFEPLTYGPPTINGLRIQGTKSAAKIKKKSAGKKKTSKSSAMCFKIYRFSRTSLISSQSDRLSAVASLTIVNKDECTVYKVRCISACVRKYRWEMYYFC